eukprot:TRINITY_DN66166_c5_g13_i1.p1 TRINITY_DN66166_c5_g13~~TRINITY_DN66166_c5_g13_i1.p1  ORF type:complete len:413 (-),score=262.15 TRINITY_DN66166_c5_g13_i1:30-1268(-)
MSDDEFGYDDSAFAASGDAADNRLVANQHHDEALSVSGDSFDDSVVTPEASPSHAAQRASRPALAVDDGQLDDSQSLSMATDEEEDEMDSRLQRQLDMQQQAMQRRQQQMQANMEQEQRGESVQQQQQEEDEQQQQQQQQQQQHLNGHGGYGGGNEYLGGSDGGGDEDDEDDDEDGDDGEVSAVNNSGADLLPDTAYDPEEHKLMDVSPEISQLFDYIGRYQPMHIQLETKLTPFIPEFIPSVGEVDGFLKPMRPDNKNDALGLTILDEPSLHQSDPTVLDLLLRVESKQSNLKPMTVRSIENADKNPAKVTTWINNVQAVHRQKPPPTVHYSKPQPDIEKLMEAWPSRFEEVLRQVPLPSAEMNMSVEEYVRVVCALLDIPTHDKLTESLHVLFTLYGEFKNNQHFQRNTQ